MTDNVQHLNVKYLWKLIDVIFMELNGYGRKGPIVSPFYGAVFFTLDPMTNIFITRTQRS